MPWHYSPWAILAGLFYSPGAITPVAAIGAEPPRAALQYQRSLTREARLQWGLTAPIPVLAGQIHQESRWDSAVCSRYACGLAQFTPDTADWISHVDPGLTAKDVFNPEWAIRALVIYDHRLLGQTPAAVPCDNWAFALSAYNGGLGWVYKDQKLCTGACNPGLWWGNVERYTSRAAEAARENRGYPRSILLVNQLIYASWGVLVSCSDSTRIPSR